MIILQQGTKKIILGTDGRRMSLSTVPSQQRLELATNKIKSARKIELLQSHIFYLFYL